MSTVGWCSCGKGRRASAHIATRRFFCRLCVFMSLNSMGLDGARPTENRQLARERSISVAAVAALSNLSNLSAGVKSTASFTRLQPIGHGRAGEFENLTFEDFFGPHEHTDIPLRAPSATNFPEAGTDDNFPRPHHSLTEDLRVSKLGDLFHKDVEHDEQGQKGLKEAAESIQNQAEIIEQKGEKSRRGIDEMEGSIHHTDEKMQHWNKTMEILENVRESQFLHLEPDRMKSFDQYLMEQHKKGTGNGLPRHDLPQMKPAVFVGQLKTFPEYSPANIGSRHRERTEQAVFDLLQ